MEPEQLVQTIKPQNKWNQITPIEVEKAPLSKWIKVALIILWIVYIPFAAFLFMTSGTAGDDPSTSALSVILSILLINGVPLLILIGTTLLVIRFAKRKSGTVKVLSQVFIIYAAFSIASYGISFLLAQFK